MRSRGSISASRSRARRLAAAGSHAGRVDDDDREGHPGPIGGRAAIEQRLQRGDRVLRQRPQLQEPADDAGRGRSASSWRSQETKVGTRPRQAAGSARTAGPAAGPGRPCGPGSAWRIIACSIGTTRPLFAGASQRTASAAARRTEPIRSPPATGLGSTLTAWASTMARIAAWRTNGDRSRPATTSDSMMNRRRSRRLSRQK